jgi:hypothetical protein
MDEFGKIPRTAAEKRYWLMPIGNGGPHSIYIPDVVLVRSAICRLTSLRIALIRQFGVTIDRQVAAPLQFSADGRFTGAGHTFDQIISDAHSG